MPAAAAALRARALRLALSPVTAALAVAAALIAVATDQGGPFLLVSALVTGGMWALVAAGLALVFGVMNIPNFAQGEFFMAGTLAAYLFFTSVTASGTAGGGLSWTMPIVTFVFAALVGGALGAAVDRTVFAALRRRTREQWVMNTFVITVGLSVLMINVHQLLWGTDYKGIYGYWPGVAPVTILGVSIGFDRLMALVVALVAVAFLAALLRFTALGRAIRAVAQDEAGAMLMGIDIGKIHTVTFAISSALAALAGAALLFMFPSFPYVGVQPLYIAWTVVILVGLGNVGGAIVGGFIVAFLQTATSYFVGSAWQDVVPFLIIVAILTLRPSGIFGRQVRGIWEQ
jgi:branched-chain amino acid transport system permease protein